MNYPMLVEDLGSRLKLFAIQVVSVLIDALFLGGWVVINWVAHKFVFTSFPLEAPDTYFLRVVQFLLAVSTFFPVAVYIVVDLLSVTLRARQSVQKLSASMDSEPSSIQEPQIGAPASEQ